MEGGKREVWGEGEGGRRGDKIGVRLEGGWKRMRKGEV